MYRFVYIGTMVFQHYINILLEIKRDAKNKDVVWNYILASVYESGLGSRQPVRPSDLCSHDSWMFRQVDTIVNWFEGDSELAGNIYETLSTRRTSSRKRKPTYKCLVD